MKKITQKNKIFLLSGIALIILINIISFTQAIEICNDGIDNDGDGLIDGVVTLDSNNGQTYTVGNDFTTIYNFVVSKVSIGTCALSGHGNAMLLSNNAPWSTGMCSSLSLSQLDPTVTKICNLAGYKDPYIWSSYYAADGGRCNWYSPASDCLWYWNGNSFTYANGEPKYTKRWITQLTCVNKLAQCNDGIDNDGDGLIDMGDSGCYNIDDNSEIAHDPYCTGDVKCKTNSDCNDNNVNTYDLCNNPGTGSSICSNAQIICSTDSDCGTNDFTGALFCQSGNIYQNFLTYRCNNPGTGSSSCTSSTTSQLKQTCAGSQTCSNGNCVAKQCADGLDNDNDGLTDAQDAGCWDNIADPNTYSSSRNDESRATINCFSDAQCGQNIFTGNKYCMNSDSYQDFRTNFCINPGRGDSSCSSSTAPRLFEDCFSGCSNGNCISAACSSDAECDDGNVYSYDSCINPGTVLSICNHSIVNCVIDNDCGVSSFIGGEFCSSNDVFKNFQTSKCINPGRQTSRCEITILPTFLIDCGESSCANYGGNYCKNGSVYHSRNCYNKGCLNGGCFSTPGTEETLIQTCLKGCESGACLPECNNNSDCGSGKLCQSNMCVTVRCYSNSDCGTEGYSGSNYCYGDGVYRDYTTYTCSNAGTILSSCSNSIEKRSISACSEGCSSGACVEDTECSHDSDCKKSYYSDEYCSNNNTLSKDFISYSCENDRCVKNENIRKYVKTCEEGCDDGDCNGNGIIGFSGFDDVETSPLIIPNVYLSKQGNGQIIVSGSGSNISEEGVYVNIKTYTSSGISNFNWFWFLVLIAIIFLVVIVIVLYVAFN